MRYQQSFTLALGTKPMSECVVIAIELNVSSIRLMVMMFQLLSVHLDLWNSFEKIADE